MRCSLGAVQAVLDAGCTERQILELILGVSQKVMSNYTNRLAQTPIDAPFRKSNGKRKLRGSARDPVTEYRRSW